MKFSQTLPCLVLALLPLLFTSCATVNYSADTLMDETSLHREIAIVPVEVNYKTPAMMSFVEGSYPNREVQESRFYQEALYNSLLHKSRKNVKVEIQPIERTNAILRECKTSLYDSWAMNPAELAKILKVDAVVKVQVEEHLYLLPVGLAKAAGVRVSCSLFDGDSGDLLWKLGLDQNASGSYDSEEIINNLNRRIVRKFPYRW
ncbi:MAG: hypothetical protein SF052_14000 [Bacteroidia bacterium]|nr:hypothetical protein [Bacteroidia bacterium]